jgi:hypothetical protein
MRVVFYVKYQKIHENSFTQALKGMAKCPVFWQYAQFCAVSSNRISSSDSSLTAPLGSSPKERGPSRRRSRYKTGMPRLAIIRRT